MIQNCNKIAVLQEFFENVAVQWRNTTLYMNISFQETEIVKNCEFYVNLVALYKSYGSVSIATICNWSGK